MTVREPKKRSDLRLKLGGAYFSAQRKLRWLSMRKHFARERSGEDLSYQAFSHHTPLMRKLKDVDMQLQRNKLTNLRLDCARLDGLLLRPGETMSYWYLIGKPTAGKGYLPGMILRNGGYLAATGGGLCQLSNLVYWMTLHTPLTVVERNHEMRAQYWGGYVRHNELYRQTFDLQGKLFAETPVAVNDAVMMYSPYLEESKKEG